MFIEVVERIYEMHVGSQFRVQPFIPVKNTTILYEPLLSRIRFKQKVLKNARVIDKGMSPPIIFSILYISE